MIFNNFLPHQRSVDMIFLLILIIYYIVDRSATTAPILIGGAEAERFNALDL